jgi:proteasome lid subunit RPN8/RPN11
MSIQLSAEHLAAIARHGEHAYPYEGCGLLLGRQVDGCKVVAEIIAVDNARESEAQHNRYLISPDEVVKGERLARQKGMDIIGFFHSHPDHPARPSDFDREHAWPWYTYLITSVQGGHAVKTTAWSLADNRSVFNPEEFQDTEERKIVKRG